MKLVGQVFCTQVFSSSFDDDNDGACWTAFNWDDETISKSVLVLVRVEVEVPPCVGPKNGHGEMDTMGRGSDCVDPSPPSPQTMGPKKGSISTRKILKIRCFFILLVQRVQCAAALLGNKDKFYRQRRSLALKYFHLVLFHIRSGDFDPSFVCLRFLSRRPSPPSVLYRRGPNTSPLPLRLHPFQYFLTPLWLLPRIL